MNVCVTGANGFVGSNLCRTLLKQGHQVVGLVRETGDLQFIDTLKGLEIAFGDLGVRQSLMQAFSGIDLVYHAAGYTSDWGDWQLFQASNIEGVKNVMECAIACGVKRVVHISTVSVYGFPGAMDISEDHAWLARPDDYYVSSKQQGEQLALGFNGKGIEVSVLRPGGLYGPNDRTTTMKIFPEIARRRFPYIDAGRHVLGPAYIDNFVQAAMLAGEKGTASGQAYNIVDDGRITWRQYVTWICDSLGCRPPRLSVSARIAWPLACAVEFAARALRLKHAPFVTRYRVRAVMRDSHFSTEKAKRQLGYQPHISTQEGIRRTVDWYRQATGGVKL